MVTLDDLFSSLDDIYPEDYIIRVVGVDGAIDGEMDNYRAVTFDNYGTFDCSDCEILFVYAYQGKVVFEIDGSQIDFNSNKSGNKALRFYKAITGSSKYDY